VPPIKTRPKVVVATTCAVTGLYEVDGTWRACQQARMQQTHPAANCQRMNPAANCQRMNPAANCQRMNPAANLLHECSVSHQRKPKPSKTNHATKHVPTVRGEAAHIRTLLLVIACGGVASWSGRIDGERFEPWEG
jgi:hypothetical protein